MIGKDIQSYAFQSECPSCGKENSLYHTKMGYQDKQKMVVTCDAAKCRSDYVVESEIAVNIKTFTLVESQPIDAFMKKD